MDPDANFQKKAAFEEAAHALIGQRIISVRYYEGRHDPKWTRYDGVSNEFHLLDFGMEFELESGKLFSVIWGSEFQSYGLSIRNDSLTKEVRDPAVWDVTQDLSWIPFVNRQIQVVNVYWEWHSLQRYGGVRHYYPQDIEICFNESQCIYIGAYV